jgi:microcystin-dependent protein
VSEPYLAEIRLVSFGFAPRGWALCNGQLLAINQNQSLFSLLGTTYGGDGRTNFALPDLRGRAPLHVDGAQGLFLGTRGGLETVTLGAAQLPPHAHPVFGDAAVATSTDPQGRWIAKKRRFGADVFAGSGATTQLASDAVAVAGSSMPHGNVQPCFALNFIIALQGLFPSQN